MSKPCPIRLLASSFIIVWSTLMPVSLFAQALATEETPDQQQVFAAALEGNLITIQQALESGYQADSADPAGRTALMYAAYNGHTQLMAKLIEAGADVNKKDQTGSTALMFASSGPFTETVALLLGKGAKINDVDSNEHFSALMWAAAEGQVEVVKLLLEHDADSTLKDIDGDTAESFAAKANHTEVVNLLHSAEPSKKE